MKRPKAQSKRRKSEIKGLDVRMTLYTQRSVVSGQEKWPGEVVGNVTKVTSGSDVRVFVSIGPWRHKTTKNYSCPTKSLSNKRTQINNTYKVLMTLSCSSNTVYRYMVTGLNVHLCKRHKRSFFILQCLCQLRGWERRGESRLVTHLLTVYLTTLWSLLSFILWTVKPI